MILALEDAIEIYFIALALHLWEALANIFIVKYCSYHIISWHRTRLKRGKHWGATTNIGKHWGALALKWVTKAHQRFY